MIRAIALSVFLAAPASAETTCLPRADLVRVLSTEYLETQRFTGLNTRLGVVVEWFAAESGTWTVFVTRLDGTSCVFATGTDFNLGDPA